MQKPLRSLLVPIFVSIKLILTNATVLFVSITIVQLFTLWYIHALQGVHKQVVHLVNMFFNMVGILLRWSLQNVFSVMKLVVKVVFIRYIMFVLMHQCVWYNMIIHYVFTNWKIILEKWQDFMGVEGQHE